MKRFVNQFFVVVLVPLVSCSWHISIQTKKPRAYPSTASSQLIAGMGQADLTAPPGYPMAGYSINGRISRGYWVRPKATALYLRDATGTPFVFVATDLWAIADGQKLGVLKILGEDSATDFIGESELLLSAIHGHHTLGINVPDNAFTFSSIGFGFNRTAFDFTVHQIAAAIKMAIQSAKPAIVSFATDTVHDISRNRSVAAYRQNNAEERRKYVNGVLASDQTEISRDELLSMIDQRLTLITVKDPGPDGKIVGLLASYPVHPTATGDATEVYSADIFGLASAYASRDMKDHPMIGFYNGAEGDVAPDYKFHNRYDAVRIATKLSQAIQIIAKSANQTLLNGTITHRTKIIDIASHDVKPDPLDAACFPASARALTRTAKNYMIGAAVFAGASDGRIALHSFGISEGAKAHSWDSLQDPKMPAIEFLAQNVFEIRKQYTWIIPLLLKVKVTAKVPISIHKVGELCFAGLPGEFTTMQGRRIRQTISTQLHSNESAVSLVGLADAYLSYITTPCEYTAQAYEGASTFFGIASGQVFVKEYEALAQKPPDNMQDRRGRKKRYDVGLHLTSFGPAHIKRLQTWDAEERLHNLLVDNNGMHLHSRFLPAMPASDTILIAPDEAVAYSFADTVHALSVGATDFYPSLMLKGVTGNSFPLPEHILTLDRYGDDQTIWTVRLPDSTQLPDEPVQIVVNKLTGGTTSASAFFRRR